MKEIRRPLFALSVAVLLVVISPAAALAATDPGLGGAGNFAVLAGTTVTNTGPTWITGLLGVSPGSAVTGIVTGSAVPVLPWPSSMLSVT